MEQSRTHRFQVGDSVNWVDGSTWPPITHSGTVKEFTNEELTYMNVEFNSPSDEPFTKELTEDDLSRA